MSDPWIMKGLSRQDPLRIRSASELTACVSEIGFLPFFANEVAGFSAEERVAADAWWTGDREQDPWEWRETIAAGHEIAYGKFFDGRAGFIAPAWLPAFANARREGWDFDGKWQSGAASLREKNLMAFFVDPESGDEPRFTGAELLSTDLKRMAGFGKGGEKNYPGVLTGLQMQLYLVIAGFRRRQNRLGVGYGMPVSVIAAPESIWGYDLMSSAYEESPGISWDRIMKHAMEMYPSAGDAAIIRLIGKRPDV
ncbi:MAG: hypothetical protein GX549_07770 [Clostridiales bacterium]|nr:hypothetical protein [Clostridiales bacterium]